MADIDDSRSKIMPAIFTLVFVKSPTQILLGFKKRGFGKNKWNGFGGKVEVGEEVQCGAIRELKEESDLTVQLTDLIYLGYVVYENKNDPIKRVVYIFETSKISGKLLETDEMRPQWFNFLEIPFSNMWPDTKYWLPLVLEGSCLKASFVYENEDEIVEKIITKLDSPPEPPN